MNRAVATLTLSLSHQGSQHHLHRHSEGRASSPAAAAAAAARAMVSVGVDMAVSVGLGSGTGSQCSLPPAAAIVHTHAVLHSHTCVSLTVLLCPVASLPRCVQCVPHAAVSFFQDDNVEDCPVCLNTFDDTHRRPRNLPCGHTLCTPCINELKEQGAVTCPTCRVSHALPEAGQFPISYITEAFIRKMRGAGLACVAPKPGKQLTAPAAVTQPAPRATAGLSKRTRSLLQEQEAKVLAAIRSCQEEQSQLADYRTTLGGWCGRQQQLEDDLQTLVDQSKGAREAISREDSRVEGRQEKVRQREEALHAMLQELRTPSTRQEAYEVIEDADHLLEEEEEEEERAAVFPDVHVVTTVARVSVSSH